jgi:hypothetical protein
VLEGGMVEHYKKNNSFHIVIQECLGKE